MLRSGGLVVAVAAGLIAVNGSGASASGPPPGPVVVTGDYTGITTTVTKAGHPGSQQTKSSVGRRQRVACTSTESFNYKANMPDTETRNGVFGVYWLVFCSDGSGGLRWVPQAEPAGVRVSPSEAARRAIGRLPLPVPVVHHNPDRMGGRPATVVGVKTWWWVSSSSFRVMRQTVRVGGVWVTVMATPVRSVWRSGSAATPTVSCAGPGRAYDASRSASSQDTDCFTVYRESSASQPQTGPSPNDRYFTASVTVVWRVTWVGSGGSRGSLPDLSRTTSFPIAVEDVQAVNN